MKEYINENTKCNTIMYKIKIDLKKDGSNKI